MIVDPPVLRIYPISSKREVSAGVFFSAVKLLYLKTPRVTLSFNMGSVDKPYA